MTPSLLRLPSALTPASRYRDGAYMGALFICTALLFEV